MEAVLSKLGLNKTEIAIYLTLLPVGTAPASVLAYRLGIKRITARRACFQLVDKGLLSVEKKDNAFIFTAESPEKIMYLLEEDKRRLLEKEDQISRIIGPLKIMANPATLLPKVRFYEGVAGVKKVYEDTLKENKSIYAFENVETMSPEIKDYVFNNYIPRRAEQNIFVKVVTPKNKDHKFCRENDKTFLRETKFLSQDVIPIEIEINIYGNKTAFFSYKDDEMFAVILDSATVANSMKSIFNFCWKFAK